MLEVMCGTGWCNSSASLPSQLVVDDVSVTSPVNSVFTRVTFFEVLVMSSPYELFQRADSEKFLEPLWSNVSIAVALADKTAMEYVLATSLVQESLCVSFPHTCIFRWWHKCGT